MATIAMPTVEAVAGLNSPPESNSALKDGGSDSELSDIEPEHETSAIPNAVPAYTSDGGVPVFKPTMAQFENFQRYIESGVNTWGMKSGIVKVIPPAEWLAAQPRLDDAVKTIRVKEPIKQDIMGTSGTYRQANIVHQRSYNLPQWRQLCDQSEHQPPAKRGERRANQDRPTKSTPRPKGAPASGNSKKSGGRSAKNKSKASKVEKMEKEGGESTPDRLPTPVSPAMKPEDDNDSIKQELEEQDDTPVRSRMGGRQPKAVSVSSRRKNNRREVAAQVDEAAFKDFKYDLEGQDYSPERCEELERIYWKTLTYASPLYGADMPGTLFDDRTTTWNLGKLDNLLDVLGSKIPGVNTAYLYLGMWKATFAWHLEDVDLYSINYLHFGAPKQWYSISQGDARRFEAAMKSIWPTDAKACDQFLRHKTFLISPSSLQQNFNIKANKIVHYPGEFVITFPYGYHSGYNLGYNCAEAVNFALNSWMEYGRVAKRCDCSDAQDSVWIDVRAIERKLRGEETDYEETDEEEEEEDEEEEDEQGIGRIDLPTPPHSGGDTKLKIPTKKRKRPASAKDVKSNAKRIRVRLKAPAKEPCILCPNDMPFEPLLTTEDGQQAHRICALYIPETSIEAGEKEIITDVKHIDKARLELKCNYCRSKKGACFQCSRKKCIRAYHATCAAAAGVLVEQGEIPVFGEDGTEYKDWGIEFSCRFHRKKRDKELDADALGEDKRIMKAAAELKAGDVCQAQYDVGGIFAGVIVENRISEEMVLVDILPRGERVEIDYRWLLIPDPADYRLPRPSANAKQLPKSYKEKESLNTSKRQVNDLPRAEDAFVTGCTWAEFNHYALPKNPFQVNINLAKENQLWHYLGKTSTEARAQYTENPFIPRNNLKAYFLDTIPKPTPVIPRQSYAASYPSNLGPNGANTPKAKTLSSPAQAEQPLQSAQPRAQPMQSSQKPEKPYVYKPRESGDVYRNDSLIYSSQQHYLQKPSPVPYAFGTDPRYQVQSPKAPTLYHKHSVPGTSASLTPRASIMPQTAYHNSSPITATPPSVRSPLVPPTMSSYHKSPLPATTASPQAAREVPQAAPYYSQSPNLAAVSPMARNLPNQQVGTPYHAQPSATPAMSTKPMALPQDSAPYHSHSVPLNTASPIVRTGASLQSPSPYHSRSPPVSVVPPPTRAPLAPVSLQRPTSATQTKLSNPFSGRSVSSKPSVFAKYSYLQKEHNRSPLEYKSPYRPGGGFMNGYQGNLQMHLQHTLFQKRSGTTESTNPILSYNGGSRLPFSSPQPAPSLPISSGTSGFRSYLDTSAKEQPEKVPPHDSTSSTPPLGTWSRKEPPQLHPAIRQEYTAMYNRQSQPPRLMQPPAMYDRQATPSHPDYQFKQASTFEQLRQPVPSAQTMSPDLPSPASKTQGSLQSPLAKENSPGGHAMPALSNGSGSQFQAHHSPEPGQPRPIPPSQGLPHPAINSASALFTQLKPGTLPTAPDQVSRRDPWYHPTVAPPAASFAPPQLEAYKSGSPAVQGPAELHTPGNQSRPTSQSAEPKEWYPPQAYAQKDFHPLAQPVPSILGHASNIRDPPDVPVDSTSIVERMMINLRKAAAREAASGK